MSSNPTTPVATIPDDAVLVWPSREALRFRFDTLIAGGPALNASAEWFELSILNFLKRRIDWGTSERTITALGLRRAIYRDLCIESFSEMVTVTAKEAEQAFTKVWANLQHLNDQFSDSHTV
jgi:hypothetical protein